MLGPPEPESGPPDATRATPAAPAPSIQRAGEPADAPEAIDPDVAPHVPEQRTVPEQRAELAGARLWLVLSVVSAGGVLGALARYAVSLAWPAPAGAFPWSTWAINVLGSGLIGVLMVLISEGGRSAHPLVRPFAGVGLLGGFTTFSAYALEFRGLLEAGRPGQALVYGGGTAAGCVGAVWFAAAATRVTVARLSATRAAARRAAGQRAAGR
ncbi:fluoride efflux transporter FluC [Streptomyces sp. NPDC055078]